MCTISYSKCNTKLWIKGLFVESIQTLVFEMSHEMVEIHVILGRIDICFPLLVC